MNCPICNDSVLPEDAKSCPHCHSDLEAFHLTSQARKIVKKRFTYTVVSSVCLVLLAIVWLLTELWQSSNESTTAGKVQSPAIDITEYQHAMQENVALQGKVEQLESKVAELTAKTAQREKIYIVRSGETLFTIARKIYGNGYKYEDIARDNNLTNPDNLQPGQKLTIFY